MPRAERGILGVKKDPKKQILFSFNTKYGDDWPSDDSDEDYVPDEEKAVVANEVLLPLRNNKRKNKSNAASNKESTSCSEPDCKRKKRNGSYISKTMERKSSGGQRDGIWGSLIPPELLHRIFQLVVKSEGSIPFLVRAQRVCSLWREVAMDTVLWTDVDLSFGWVKKVPNLLLRLCDSKFPKVKRLNLTGWQKLNGDSLKVIGSKCTKLESLNLSQCKKVTSSGLHALIDSCPSISSLILSDLSADIHSVKSLSIIMEKCGKKLKELSLSHNRVSGINSTIKCIYETCSSLEVLDLSHMTFNSEYLSLSIESLQAGCPLLRVLNLNGSLIRVSPYCVAPCAPSHHGFEHLEELHLAGHGSSVLGACGHFDSTILRALLWNSHKLRVLDIRCNGGRMVEDIYNHVPLASLQYLYASRCDLVKEENFWKVLEKCRQTLQELHIEWASYNESRNEEALLVLAGAPQTSQLRVLNATGTLLSAPAVRAVIDGCPKLESLDLTSCRGLPRGVKRLHNNRKHFGELKERLSDV